jgi:hypothetical protein
VSYVGSLHVVRSRFAVSSAGLGDVGFIVDPLLSDASQVCRNVFGVFGEVLVCLGNATCSGLAASSAFSIDLLHGDSWTSCGIGRLERS